MGLTGGKGSEGWGMGFFLVFFPEESPTHSKKKTNLFSSSPSSSCLKPTSTPVNTLFKRSNSTQLLSKAQSTISICALLLFISLLLFTLSTFEPTTTHHSFSRRHLSSKSSPFSFKPNSQTQYNKQLHALQGMGTLYRKGTSAMTDLIVSHIPDFTTPQEFRIFLRLFHRSAITSRSDLVFVFPNSTSLHFQHIIRQENESFFKLTALNITHFSKSIKKDKDRGEPIWGRGTRTHNFTGDDKNETESTRLNYGSVVGFIADELDPENSLSGFIDHVPMSLRRWACYPMLLGRVRRNFKHVMLVDIKDVLLFTDPLSPVRNKSPETVYLSTVTQTTTTKHGRKNSDKTQSLHRVNPGIIMGGGRGVRRLSNAMLTEIVRATMQHKRKNSVSDSLVLSQLAGSGFVAKNVNLITSTESIPDASSLNSASFLSLANHSVVMRGNSNTDLNAVITRHLCSLPLHSSVYSDC